MARAVKETRWQQGERKMQSDARGNRVVILGGGFGGLSAARALKSAPVDVTLIDRRNYHLFQPLLYQVATGSPSPGDIPAPIRAAPRPPNDTRLLPPHVSH